MPIPSPNGAGARRRLYEQFPGLASVREIADPDLQVLGFAAGEALFARRSKVDRLFFLLSGQVEEQGLRRDATGARQPRLTRLLTPTAQRPLPILGLYDYLYGQNHSTHAVARSYCQVLVMTSTVFEKILFHQPEL